MATRDLTAANFMLTITANSNVLVYFWAPKCPPCDLLGPVYDASSQRHFDIVHGKVNYETEQDLASTADVKNLPTLMAFKKGKLVFKQAGVADGGIMDNLVQHLRAYKLRS